MASQESRIQKVVVDWFDVAASGFGLDARTLFHVPNGGKRKKIEAAILKGMGVRAGVSDLFLAVPKRVTASAEFRGGMFIEMKAPDGRVTTEQNEFIAIVQRAGYAAIVCWSTDEAIRAIINYLRCGDPLKK